MKILIIEDEQPTADDLAENILELAPEVQIIAQLNSVKEAIDWFKKNEQPDLIFCDIQLGDGLCFEIFKTQHISTPVIFCTAFDEYALNAFKSNAIDYILKPFDKQTISDALSKYKELKRRFSDNSLQLDTIFKIFENRVNQKKASVLVYYRDKILPLRTENIAIFYIEHELTYLVTFEQKSFTINKSLEELEKITGSEFYRANRQYLINRKAIKEVSQYFARKLSISLNIPLKESIIVNKVKVPDFLNWLSES